MNKEKLITEMRNRYKYLYNKIINSTNSDSIQYLQAKIFELENWIEKIENGEFNNN